MDTLTHSLVAVALSRVFFKKRVAYATAALVIAANLPDLDLLYSWPGIRYIEYHNGLLHSLGMLPVWAVLVAWGLRWYSQRQNKPLPTWRIAFVLGLVGVASHILLDWTTGYGVRLFAPFSERWFSLDLMPTYDPWMWLMLAAFLGFPMLLGLIVNEVGSVKRNTSHRISAAIALAIFAGWVGLRARQHSDALDLLNAPDVAIFYQGQLPYDWAAFPATSDPFAWQAVIDLPRNDLIASVTTEWNPDFGRVTPIRSYIKPPAEPAMARAEQTRTGEIFMWFARFPFVDVEDQASASMVVMTDMRFAQGVQRPAIKAKVLVDGSLHLISQSFIW